jgi:uncharacterized protein (UPF0548 family)
MAFVDLPAFGLPITNPMFLAAKPSEETIRRFIASQHQLPFSYREVGATRAELPANYTIDHNRIQLGNGRARYERAMAALQKWKQFDLGWALIVPPETPIEAGNTVAMRARHFGFWSLNACRIVYVIPDGTKIGEHESGAVERGEMRRFGYAYGTLPNHAELGEERFSVEWRADDSVWYDILAFSRPHQFAPRLGYPITRRLQKRFVRESLQAMVKFSND